MESETRIAFGDEGRQTGSGVVNYTPVDEERCPDCDVRRGALHEPGCNLEQCPICREPLAHCGHQRQVLD